MIPPPVFGLKGQVELADDIDPPSADRRVGG